MVDISEIPGKIKISCDNGDDARVRFEKNGSQLDVFVSAGVSRPKLITLRWDGRTQADVRVLGDTWERSYSNLGWRSIESSRYMPWYFLVSSQGVTVGCGVKTGCNSFVSFLYDAGGVTCFIDVRSGSYGVNIGSRELLAASIVCERYENTDEFNAARAFCRRLCDKPLSPKQPVYGGNNWYYAYGKSSREDILGDARLQARLSEGLSNRPYMVIDDGWQKIPCCGPWEANEKFGDMKTLAAEIKALGVRPGIWVRLLRDKNPEIPDSWRFSGDAKAYLDPSVPQTLDYVRKTVRGLCDMGYELIKHDFSTYDIFGDWGKNLGGLITHSENLRFHDSSKTSAQIVLDFYRAIREAAGEAVIIGCNTVSHLCAGLVELNRIGDDTSGESWDRTLRYGVNTLAFRLPQHGAFYDIDADCVGILGDCIPWELNSQWLDLLARSATPLFISCPEGGVSPAQLEQLKNAYALASEQTSSVQPADWLYNDLPRKWKAADGEIYYDWTKNYLPGSPH